MGEVGGWENHLGNGVGGAEGGGARTQCSICLENLARVSQVEGHWYQLTRTGALGSRSSGGKRIDSDPLRRGPQRKEESPGSFRGDAKDGLEAHAALLHSGT